MTRKRNVHRICETCGKEFMGYSDQKFCCGKCIRYTTICEVCGAVITSKSFGKKTCSENCFRIRKKAMQKKHERVIDEPKPLDITSALIIVDWIDGRRHMTVKQVAEELRRPETDVRGFIERLKASGDWDRVKRILNRPTELPMHSAMYGHLVTPLRDSNMLHLA